MEINIHSSFLPHEDPEESLAFYRDVLGFEVRLDVGNGKMRWITVGPVDQPDTSIVLSPPAVDPGKPSRPSLGPPAQAGQSRPYVVAAPPPPRSPEGGSTADGMGTGDLLSTEP